MTNDIDFKEIEALFTVIEKCVAHSGKYPGIMAEAQMRLSEINTDLREAQMEAAAREAEAAAEAATPKAIPAEPDDDEDPDPATMSTTQRRL